MEDQEIKSSMDESTLQAIWDKTQRIEKGVEEIYKLLMIQKGINGLVAEGKSVTKGDNTCDSCGEPAVVREGTSAKNGKHWRAKFCSTDNKSHTTWL